MTGPIGDSVGEVRADLRIDSRKTPDDVEDGLRKAGRAADDDAKDIGENWGRVSADAMGAELERNGPRIARSVQEGLDRERVVSRVTVQYDREGNVARRWVTEVARDLRREAVAASGEGGPLNAVGRIVGDAVGAGFNISGRSPLIALLIPILGAIIALVFAAIHAIHALVALLYTIPNLLFAIGLQAGVLLLIFQGLAETIGAAFSAKNPQELAEALKDVNPAVATFVKSLLGLRETFKQLQDIAQTNFFGKLGTALTDIVKNTFYLPSIIANIASSLGTLLNQFLTFFSSPLFQEFLVKSTGSIVRFLGALGPALVTFLEGLTHFGIAMMPFVEEFGEGFANLLVQIGRWLTRLSGDEEFLGWLDRVWTSLGLVVDLTYSIIQFFQVIAYWLDQSGRGDALLKVLTDLITMLNFLMTTEPGQKALEGLLRLVVGLTVVFFGMIYAIGLVLAALTYFQDWILATLLPSLADFFEWFGKAWVQLLGVVGSFIASLIEMIGSAISWIIELIFKLFMDIITWAARSGKTVGDWFGITLPNMIKNAVAHFGTVLVDAGRNLWNGLLDGIKSAFPNIGNVMSKGLSMIRSFLPFSPAKEGPLSGSGDPLIAGQKIIDRLATGMLMETPALAVASNTATSSITFGANAINVGFHGALPTQEQAQMTGMAAGRGIMDALARRNTRLQVRTM